MSLPSRLRLVLPCILLAAAVLLAACGGPRATATPGPKTGATAKPGAPATLSPSLIAPVTPMPFTPSLAPPSPNPPQKTGPATTATQPPVGATPAGAAVSFSRDVQPIFNQQCRACHIDQSLGGLSLRDHGSLMKGGQRGPAVVPASPDTSLIIRKLRGDAAAGERMPKGGQPLSEDAIRKIADWIRQGALNN